MSAKLFTVAGVSKLTASEPLKLRVATGSAKGRANVLTRNGHADVQLFDLPKPMDKEAARAWLIAKGIGLAVVAADSFDDTAKKPTKAAVKATATKVKARLAASEANAVEAIVPVSTSEAALSPEAKLALKRARDAARKREKRAAAKAAA